MRKRLAVFILLCGVSMLSAAQEMLKEGDMLPALALKDQHDKPVEVSASTRQLLFAADNGGAGLVTDLLDSLEPGWLASTQSVYLADIHRMPGMVLRMMALPRLREKPYPIALGREADDMAMFPRKKDCVTVIPSSDGKAGIVSFACSAAELRALIADAPKR